MIAAKINPKNRHRLPALLLAVAWVLAAGCQTARVRSFPKTQPPNIVFILADDLGYGDIGPYGQRQVPTPHLDRLAAAGLRFTQFYAGAPVCAPSRCALFTGRHTGHAYIRGNREIRPMGQQPLPDSLTTFAADFQRAGYFTAMIGKWGLGGPGSGSTPNDKGFDYFYGYLCQRHAHNYYPSFLYENDRRFTLPNVVPNEKPDGTGRASVRQAYVPDLMEQQAMRFLDEHRREPFLLMLTTALPHANGEAGPEGMEVPAYEAFTRPEWPAPQRGLASMISRLDGLVGRLRARLEQLGLAENTIIVFTSDNGPHREGGNDPTFFHSSGPLRGLKRDVYEGGIRVPLLVAWPGRITPGTEEHFVGAFWDLPATLAELAGLKTLPATDGRSFARLLTQRQAPAPAPYWYWEFHEGGGKQGLRQGDWKAVRLHVDSLPHGPLELYDLRTDPGETRNVATGHPAVVRRLDSLMQQAHVPSQLFPFGREK